MPLSLDAASAQPASLPIASDEGAAEAVVAGTPEPAALARPEPLDLDDLDALSNDAPNLDTLLQQLERETPPVPAGSRAPERAAPVPRLDTARANRPSEASP
jgi:hypothetical protein